MNYWRPANPDICRRKCCQPQDAIAGIHEAGGVAIWAHPPFDRKARSWDEYETILQQWISWGLDGLETFYFTYTSEEAAWTARMAEKYGFAARRRQRFSWRAQSQSAGHHADRRRRAG